MPARWWRSGRSPCRSARASSLRWWARPGRGSPPLLAIAGTLEQPTSGTVRVGGRRSGPDDRPGVVGVGRLRIGFVFQQFFLIPTLAALDNVANGLSIGASRSRAPPGGEGSSRHGSGWPTARPPARRAVRRRVPARRHRPGTGRATRRSSSPTSRTGSLDSATGGGHGALAGLTLRVRRSWSSPTTRRSRRPPEDDPTARRRRSIATADSMGTPPAGSDGVGAGEQRRAACGVGRRRGRSRLLGLRAVRRARCSRRPASPWASPPWWGSSGSPAPAAPSSWRRSTPSVPTC